jgi:hypothetical protein
MRSLAIVVALLAGSAAEARTRLYAVVVAENRSLDPGVPPLQYADDDGVKNWELLSLYTGRASLFVVLDEDTARLHPEAARHAEVPERAAIFARLRRYNELMARDLARGDDPELFFVYAGHGNVDATGQGYVNLHDAKLTRTDLYREIIAPSRARFVHVIIDACKSYFMVRSRGGEWKDDSVPAAEDRSDRRVHAFLEAEKLERYPRAGVIVATSGAQDAHEWSRYRGGILSHELRSGLSGAADVNGDRIVEYSELLAFLAAANARVLLPQAQIQVFSRPPALDRRRPLVDLRRARRRGQGRLLHFGSSLSGRFYVEDERGVRYADLNKEPGSAFDLLVSTKRRYFVRRDDREEIEVSPSSRRIDLSRMAWTPLAVAARGAVDESFRKDLYRVAFGPRFYEGYIAKSGDVPVETTSVAEAPRDRAHLFGFGYALSGAPAGDAGLSHGAELRYGFRLRPWLDLGPVVELGYGSGGPGAAGLRQTLSRVALLFGVGFEHRLLSRLSLRADAAVGWQLLSGTVDLGGSSTTGTEPRGLRLEVGAGLVIDLARSLSLVLRGGLAIDGAYAGEDGSSTRPAAFMTLGLRFAL